MRFVVRIIIAILVMLLAFASSVSLDLECSDCEGVTIVSWNVQNLGPTKLADGRALAIATILSDYDIITVQEITDASEQAGAFLCTYFENHSCTVSERTGQGTRKEQYLIASRYPLENATLVEHDELERGVYLADIDLGYRSVTIATAHLKPDRVPEELTVLEMILPESVILTGDLNADCRYLPEGTRTYLSHLYWIIPDREDTTPARSQCAYDRFVVSRDALELIIGYDVVRINGTLSDHHPIVLTID